MNKEKSRESPINPSFTKLRIRHLHLRSVGRINLPPIIGLRNKSTILDVPTLHPWCYLGTTEWIKYIVMIIARTNLIFYLIWLLSIDCRSSIKLKGEWDPAIGDNWSFMGIEFETVFLSDCSQCNCRLLWIRTTK